MITSSSLKWNLLIMDNRWDFYQMIPSHDQSHGTFEYDNKYLQLRFNGKFSHIVITWEYEFREDGNMLCITYVPEMSDAIPDITYVEYLKV